MFQNILKTSGIFQNIKLPVYSKTNIVAMFQSIVENSGIFQNIVQNSEIFSQLHRQLSELAQTGYSFHGTFGNQAAAARRHTQVYSSVIYTRLYVASYFPGFKNNQCWTKLLLKLDFSDVFTRTEKLRTR